MKEDRLRSVGRLDHLSQSRPLAFWNCGGQDPSKDIHSNSSVVASRSEYGWIGRMPGDRVHSARGMCFKRDD